MSQEQRDNIGQRRLNLVFSCSGAADVGAIADQAARNLARERVANMCCSAAIAAGVPEVLTKADFATDIVVIDGCDKACTKSIMEKAGFPRCGHVQVTSLGMTKGETPVCDDNILKVVNAATKLFRQ